MKRCLSFLAVICCLLAVTGCGSPEAVIGPKKEVAAYSEKLLKLDSPLELEVKCDSANIELYTWNKKEIKFEISRRIRGTGSEDSLNKKLNDFIISEKQDKSRVSFASRYAKTIRQPQDVRIDLKILAPKQISSMKYDLDIGSIKLFDTVTCNLAEFHVNMANVDINKLEGRLAFKGDMGNLRVGGGFLYDGSNADVNMGNMGIDAAMQERGNYSFRTGVGNIDMQLPPDTRLSVDNIGTVEANEFEGAQYTGRIRLCSEMGKITVRKQK